MSNGTHDDNSFFYDADDDYPAGSTTQQPSRLRQIGGQLKERAKESAKENTARGVGYLWGRFGHIVVIVALILVGLAVSQSLPGWNATIDRVFLNNFGSVSAKSQSDEGTRLAGDWYGTDNNGTTWYFSLTEDGLVSDLRSVAREDGLVPSLDALSPVGIPEKSHWSYRDSEVRFAGVVDGASIHWDIEEVRPSEGSEPATVLVLKAGAGQLASGRQLLVERAETLFVTEPGAEPGAEPVYADTLPESVWHGDAGMDTAFLRFDKDGKGILRIGGSEKSWQVFPLTWERTDEAGAPLERGDHLTVTVPNAGSKGTIVLKGQSLTGDTTLFLEGRDGNGEEVVLAAEAAPGNYSPVEENSVPDTVWVGTTGSEATASVRFRADGTGEVKLTDFGTATYDALWSLDGNALTLEIPEATALSGITYTGTTTPYGQTLSLTGTDPDGETVSMELVLADIKPLN